MTDQRLIDAICEALTSLRPFSATTDLPERLAQRLESKVIWRDDADEDFVVLPRGPLFEFFGAMALPPWQDEKGKTIDSNILCAPIAEKIREWVESHDLGTSVIGRAGSGEQ